MTFEFYTTFLWLEIDEISVILNTNIYFMFRFVSLSSVSASLFNLLQFDSQQFANFIYRIFKWCSGQRSLWNVPARDVDIYLWLKLVGNAFRFHILYNLVDMIVINAYDQNNISINIIINNQYIVASLKRVLVTISYLKKRQYDIFHLIYKATLNKISNKSCLLIYCIVFMRFITCANLVCQQS